MSTGSRTSARDKKPLGFYKAMAEGEDLTSYQQDKELSNDGNSSSDEELLELRKVEQQMSGQVAEKRQRLKSRKSERIEREKQKLRERIDALKQQTAVLEAKLQDQELSSDTENSRDRHKSRSLPDSSEYQKLLNDLTRLGSSDKSYSNSKYSKKLKSKKTSRSEKKKQRKNKTTDLAEQMQKIFVDPMGGVRIPSAEELKHLVSIAESSKSSSHGKSATSDKSDDSSSKASSSSSSESERDSEQERTRSKKKKKGKHKKIVSGRLQEVDKADIVKSVKYPHVKLDSDFVKSRTFDSLSFHHLVAGELEIISRLPCDSEERSARVGILKYLAYHFAYLDTQEIREQYDAIMKKVERGELTWNSKLAKKVNKSLTFRRDARLAERKSLEEHSKRSEAKDKKPKTEKVLEKKGKEEEVIYCADYNRNKCEFSTSHLGKWAGKEVMKLHICKKCLSEDGLKKAHPETDDKCPKKQ